MKKFIYVFSKDAKDSLLKLGFKLMKSDEERGLFIFMNKDDASFYSIADYSFVESDILTF